MRQSHRQAQLLRTSRRLGSAAVEFAVVSPLLILMVMGTIDVGQFVSVGQTVNNASREGARRACRNAVKTVSEVETAVQAYLANTFPNVSPAEINAAVTVTVVDGSGNAISGGDLTTVPSGESVSVTVTFQYETVRWVSGFPGVTGQSLRTKTVMRRE